METGLWKRSVIILAFTSVLCLVVLCLHVNRPLKINKVLKPPSSLSASSEVSGECASDYSCASCSQVRVCQQVGHALREMYRLSCSGHTPYCDALTGTCVPVPTKECANVGMFKCVRDGVFPDPSNCSTYHICENSSSLTLLCQSGQYFNGTHCDSRTSCYTFTSACNSKSHVKVPHDGDPNAFAYCVNGKVLFVDRCPEDELLHPNQQQCQAKYKHKKCP